MNTRQRKLIDFLLSTDFPGAATLRRQAASAVIESEDEAGGFMLSVPPNSARAEVVDDVPVEAHWDSTNSVVELLLVAPGGLLGEVEVVRYNHEEAELPDLCEFKLLPRLYRGQKLRPSRHTPSTN
jgi:hypothetical protein